MTEPLKRRYEQLKMGKDQTRAMFLSLVCTNYLGISLASEGLGRSEPASDQLHVRPARLLWGPPCL